MRKVLIAALALAAIPAVAQPQPPMKAPGSRNPGAVVAGGYTFDPDHSMVIWTIDHMGFTPYTGIFGGVTGTLTIDPRNLAATKVEAAIPVSKVTTANAGLTAHLLRPGKDGGKPDFFGAAAADARFVSTKVVVGKGGTARVTGDFTLNGITRPVTLDVSFYGTGALPPQMGGGTGLGFRGTGTIRRSEFGLGFGVPVVGDEVKLYIAAGFMKK